MHDLWCFDKNLKTKTLKTSGIGIKASSRRQVMARLHTNNMEIESDGATICADSNER